MAQLLTSAQVAKEAKRNLKTIYRWVDKGKLSPIQKLDGPRGAYLFDRRHVTQVLRQDAAERNEKSVRRAALHRPEHVYRIYDSRGRLLYVGRSSRPGMRIYNHQIDSFWYAYADRFEIDSPLSAEDAAEEEVRQIQTYRPVFNVFHNQRTTQEGMDLYVQMLNADEESAA